MGKNGSWLDTAGALALSLDRTGAFIGASNGSSNRCAGMGALSAWIAHRRQIQPAALAAPPRLRAALSSSAKASVHSTQAP